MFLFRGVVSHNEILDEGVITEAVEKVTKLTSQKQQPQKEGGAEVKLQQ